MSLRLHALLATFLCTSALVGCDNAARSHLGQGRLELTSDILGGTDVAGIAYTATQVDCATGLPLATPHVVVAVEDLEDAFLPGGDPGLANAPLDANSQHLFADHFFWLDAGCWSVTAQPIDANGAPSADCAPATNPNVAVLDGQTTEILLISQCQNDPQGALDVIVVLNHPPQITGMTYGPSKFVCGGEVEICIDVTDVDGDPLTIDWGVGAPISAQTATPTADGMRFCATFTFANPGDYQFTATVYDMGYDANGNLVTMESLLAAQGDPNPSHDNITFPVHVLSDDACLHQCDCPDQAPMGVRLPLLPGEQVATCASTGEGGFVIGVIDARRPECFADVDENWLAPMYHNERALSPTGLAAHEWHRANLGEVFGVALDDAAAPNIYTTATTTYGNAAVGANGGRVWKLDGTTGVPTLLATLPNTGPGLGNIAHDRAHQQLFVTNFEDGRIYRLSMAGAILQAYDPFAPDDGAPGFANLRERVWGVAVYGCHLYFGTWAADGGRPGPANSVWSVDIAGDGSLVGREVLQFPVFQATNQPISDLELSGDGKLIVAQRGMGSDTQPQPHNSGVYEYVGGHNAWVPSATMFSIGAIAGGHNSAGGADYDCADACEDPLHLAATGDALHLNAPENIYGVQIVPATGGDITNSHLIDLDGDTVGQDKTQLGDVDYVKPCAARPPECRDAAGGGVP